MDQIRLSKFGIFLSIILTFFSTFVLAYISMATMIGPWIAPTLVLIAGMVLKFDKTRKKHKKTQEIALIQTVGSVGGIVATAVGFTIPTLYFLDRTVFDRLIANPLHFSILVGAVCLAGGSLGIMLGRTFRGRLLKREDLSHPVSKLVHNTITSQTQGHQTKRMVTGFSISMGMGLLRDKLGVLPPLPIMISPMLWAIGFIAGLKVALPLLIGMLSKYLVLYPINNHSLYLPFKLFPVFDKKVFSMAFASGLALSEAISGVLKYPSIIFNSIKQYSGYSYFNRLGPSKNILKKLINFEAIFSTLATIALLIYLNFSLLSLLIIAPLTIIAAYNITIIGCKIGLVQIGRFATFVMIPTIMFFKLSALQVTMLCVLVSTCITTTANFLFDYKIGELCEVEHTRIHRYQWLGVLVTSACIGFFLWLLFTNLGIGTEQLFAQRGKSRALLIQSFNFDLTVVSIGFLYGLVLKKLRVSPTMVFGGLLMPNGLTLGLVFGAIGTLFVKNKNDHLSFFSGIFSGESIWFILNVLSRVF